MNGNQKVSDKKRLQVNIDKELSDNVDGVLDTLGLNPTTLVTALYKRVAAEGRVPFELAMTADEKLNHDLMVALQQTPKGEIKTAEELDEWLSKYK